VSFAYHYYPGADGLRCCYASSPTFRCPLVETREPDLLIQATASMLECDAVKLAQIFERAHRRNLRERDDAGKYTGRCQVCGTQLDRIGFGAWKEHDKSEAANVGERISRDVFGAIVEQLGPRRYFDRKREAMEWCREEAKISVAAAAE
jgi:hypothetical protein